MDHLNLKINEDWSLDTKVVNFDKDILLDSIILKAGTMEPVYTDPYFLQQMSGAWWRKWKPTFDKWWIAAEKEYEPLWDREGWEEIDDETINDGTTGQTTVNTETMDDDTSKHATTREVMDDDTTKQSTNTETMDDDTTKSLNSTETIDEDTTSSSTTSSTTTDHTETTGSTTNSVSAFNQVPPNTYSPHDMQSTSSTENSNGTVSTTANGSGTNDRTTTLTQSETGTDDRTTTTTYSETGTDDRTTDTTYDETGTDDRTTNFNGQVDGESHNKQTYGHKLHSWGNWGISQTAQKLLQAEFGVRYVTNPYDLMTEIFCREMLVRVF